MKEIPLTRGKVAIVDDEDYLWLSRYKWHCVGKPQKLYACRKQGGKRLFMHVEIFTNGGKAPLPEGMQVDHADGNQFNNTRPNLRLATPTENAANKPHIGGTSQYRGVSWHKQISRWTVHIGGTYIGTFTDEIEAAKAYDIEAQKRHGKFARLNFPMVCEAV